MRVSDFAKLVAEKEGKKKQVDIAQIKEVLRVTSNLLDGGLYVMIHDMDEEDMYDDGGSFYANWENIEEYKE